MADETTNGTHAPGAPGPTPEQLQAAIGEFGAALLGTMRTPDGQLTFDLASLIINQRLTAMRLHALVQELCHVTPLDSAQIDVRLLERLKVVTEQLSGPQLAVAVANAIRPRNG